MLNKKVDKVKSLLDSKIVTLTDLERELLLLLLSHDYCSKSFLKDTLWEGKVVSENSLPVLVSKLRKKIHPVKINNNKKYGYSVDYDHHCGNTMGNKMFIKKNAGKINVIIIYLLLIYLFVIVVIA